MAWEQSARQLHDLVRAVTHPYPGAFTSWNGERLFVWRARAMHGGGVPGEVLQIHPGSGVVVAAGSGALLLERVQLAGDGELRADELALRRGLAPGERLGG